MSLTVKAGESTGNFTPAPQGTHLAICVQIIDLGTQHNAMFDKYNEKVLIGWELVNTVNEDRDGDPFLVWNEYTKSIHEKANLTKDLTAWLGEELTKAGNDGYPLNKLLGQSCFLTIVHKKNADGTRTYARVAGVIAVPEGTDVPKQTLKSILFDLEKPDMEVYETFSDYLKGRISDSPEFNKAQGGQEGHFLDDITADVVKPTRNPLDDTPQPEPVPVLDSEVDEKGEEKDDIPF